MRRLLLALVILLSAGCAPRRPASLAFTPSLVKIERLYAGEVRQFQVKLENSGDRATAITKLQGSCHCLTIPDGLPQTLGAHASMDIQATFDSVHFAGNVSRDIIAEYPPKQVAVCEMRCQVVETMSFPANTNLTQVAVGQTVTHSFAFEAKQLPGDKLHISKLSSTDPANLVGTDFTQTAVEPGGHGTVAFKMTGRKPGDYHETLWLELDQPAKMKLGFDVYAKVVEPDHG